MHIKRYSIDSQTDIDSFIPSTQTDPVFGMKSSVQSRNTAAWNKTQRLLSSCSVIYWHIHIHKITIHNTCVRLLLTHSPSPEHTGEYWYWPLIEIHNCLVPCMQGRVHSTPHINRQPNWLMDEHKHTSKVHFECPLCTESEPSACHCQRRTCWWNNDRGRWVHAYKRLHHDCKTKSRSNGSILTIQDPSWLFRMYYSTTSPSWNTNFSNPFSPKFLMHSVLTLIGWGRN